MIKHGCKNPYEVCKLLFENIFCLFRDCELCPLTNLP